jgi:hypothetical protein
VSVCSGTLVHPTVFFFVSVPYSQNVPVNLKAMETTGKIFTRETTSICEKKAFLLWKLYISHSRSGTSTSVEISDIWFLKDGTFVEGLCCPTLDFVIVF